MDDNCHVEPIYKDSVSAETLRNADNALLAVWGMGCENCVTRVRNSLLSVEGVFGVDVYLNMAMAEVRYDGKMVSPETLVNAVARAGNDGRHEYRAQFVSGEVVNP
ncbi:MAG TPA: cation transporter [Anaerolineales bacterium]|nr:cation transporter [Anaerolineales bacterium]